MPTCETTEIRIERDVPYLGPERAEKLDVYLPADGGGRLAPAVLLIHGGGWRVCDKADARERNIGRNLAAAGYVVFSINYLLNEGRKDPATGRVVTTRIAWPQNFHDCKSALRFIRAEAERFGVDPERIAAMGGSAGGHLAMLVGATADHAEWNRHGLYLEQSNAVSCVLTFYGDFDVRGRVPSAFPGATPEQTAENEAAASPITYFDSRTPPIFITHGTADPTVPVERSRALARHLEGMGLDYWYVEIGGSAAHISPRAGANGFASGGAGVSDEALGWDSRKEVRGKRLEGSF